MLYSGADVELWEFLMRETEDIQLRKAFQDSLKSMQRYCVNLSCRHRQLVEHFGQNLDCENCGACDICLEELQPVTDSLIVGQKVASSIVRQGQRYGAAYTAQVLKGKSLERIRENKHHELSTYGLLRDESEQQIRSWIDQLLSQGFLKKVGEYNCLEVTERGWKMLRGEERPHLLMLRPARKKSKREDDHWKASIAICSKNSGFCGCDLLVRRAFHLTLSSVMPRFATWLDSVPPPLRISAVFMVLAPRRSESTAK